MFCFAIINSDTGDIEHCFVDNGANSQPLYNMIDGGELPIKISPMPDNFFCTILTEEELESAFADPMVDRFSNDISVIRSGIRKTWKSEWDAVRIREEIKVFRDIQKDQLRGVAKNPEIKNSRIEVRNRRAKINEVRGTIITDLENYDSIVEIDRKKAKEEELELERKRNLNIDELKKQIKEELMAELIKEKIL